MDKDNFDINDANIGLVEEIKKEENAEKYSKKNKNNDRNVYKDKYCKVINYNKTNKTLDVKFDTYGIRIENVDDYNGKEYVTIKYKSEIGKPDFEYKL